jgi:hypothetical protein
MFLPYIESEKISPRARCFLLASRRGGSVAACALRAAAL